MAAQLDAPTRAIITACIPALEAHGLDITREMYARLLADPAIGALFNRSHQNSGEQPTALALAVLTYARNINNLSSLAGMIERIAEKHVGLNILPEHYPLVGAALLGAIQHVLGDAATPDIMQAWAKGYQFLADVLINRESQLYKATEQAPGGWAGWRAFTITARTVESPKVTSFVLTPADGQPVLRHKPGQYLSFNITVPGHGTQRRTYSISSAANGTDYRISVSRAPQGLVSNWLHDHAPVGTQVLVSAPAGSFTLAQPVQEPAPLVLLSAGVGLTPFMAMLDSATTAGAAGPKRHYIHGTHSAQTEAFGPHIRALAAKGLVQADVFYTHGAEHPAPLATTQPPASAVRTHNGRITPAWVRTNTPAESVFYICGPEEFMEEMISGLQATGVPETHIKYEVFGPATTLEDTMNAA